MSVLIPGFPNLSVPVTVDTAIASVLAGIDGAIWDVFARKPLWGIYDQNGQKALEPDTMLDLDFRNESFISNFPTQNAGFCSYNKVHTPYNATIIMSKGGSEVDRINFLDKLSTIADDTKLYNVVMPEKSYLNCNITMHGFRRSTEEGAGMLTVEIGLVEIQQKTAKYSKSAATTKIDTPTDATAEPVQNAGTVDPQPVPEATNQSLLKRILN